MQNEDTANSKRFTVTLKIISDYTPLEGLVQTLLVIYVIMAHSFMMKVQDR